MVFTMAEKNKIKTEYTKRYRKANKSKKSEILDGYLKLLGKGNRKYAFFTLNREGKKQFRNPLINYFYPTKKNYEKRLKTPYQRLFEHPVHVYKA
jgi:hypothetical protein